MYTHCSGIASSMPACMSSACARSSFMLHARLDHVVSPLTAFSGKPPNAPAIR